MRNECILCSMKYLCQETREYMLKRFGQFDKVASKIDDFCPIEDSWIRFAMSTEKYLQERGMLENADDIDG